MDLRTMQVFGDVKSDSNTNNSKVANGVEITHNSENTFILNSATSRLLQDYIDNNFPGDNTVPKYSFIEMETTIKRCINHLFRVFREEFKIDLPDDFLDGFRHAENVDDLRICGNQYLKFFRNLYEVYPITREMRESRYASEIFSDMCYLYSFLNR